MRRDQRDDSKRQTALRIVYVDSADGLVAVTMTAGVEKIFRDAQCRLPGARGDAGRPKLRPGVTKSARCGNRPAHLERSDRCGYDRILHCSSSDRAGGFRARLD